jgi:hypothetical protein
MKPQGKLYILFHETFAQYGENIYKIGRSVDPKDRMKNAYTTPFLTNAKYLYTSSEFDDVVRAERILFFLLRRERIRDRREFFEISLERAIAVIKRLERLEGEIPFVKLYALMSLQLIPYGMIKQLQTGEAAAEYIDRLNPEEFDRSLDMDTWFEQFRFRPSKPEVYKQMGLTFITAEDADINKLMSFLSKSVEEDEDEIDGVSEQFSTKLQ